MRLSTDEDRDEERALATIAAATEEGVTVFDTARAYGRGADELGHNERLLARGLRSSGAAARARVVTKGGMARPGGAWVPDGRVKAVRADCEASLASLDGLPIDLYLLHAPDPRTPWRTSVRALARLLDEGLVRRIGVANVNRTQLDEALVLAPIAAVQVALSPYDDRALRGGLVERCAEAGVVVIAHSPLGGPRRAPGLARIAALADVSAAHEATAHEVALAWLAGLSPTLVAIPGARRPATARSAAGASSLDLTADERARLERELGGVRPAPAKRRRPLRAADVVVVMGIPGSGKTRVAQEYVGSGYARLNRDELGGSLRDMAVALDEALAAGSRRVVLDNTYLTRASRSHVLDAAGSHGAPVRCVWLDTPLAQAQVNLVERLLDRSGSLPAPAELKRLARSEAGVHTPTTQMRTVRELEPPATEEGFVAVEQVRFERVPGSGRAGVFVAASALRAGDWDGSSPETAAPHLVFDWSADGSAADLPELVARLAAHVAGDVESALCPHGGGPPTCWCRPPLPGLPLAFARARGVEPARSTLVGTAPAHRTLANALGARYVAA